MDEDDERAELGRQISGRVGRHGSHHDERTRTFSLHDVLIGGKLMDRRGHEPAAVHMAVDQTCSNTIDRFKRRYPEITLEIIVDDA
jgi:hypothetical protein